MFHGVCHGMGLGEGGGEGLGKDEGPRNGESGLSGTRGGIVQGEAVAPPGARVWCRRAVPRGRLSVAAWVPNPAPSDDAFPEPCANDFSEPSRHSYAP